MTVLSIGRRRLHISLRLERVERDSGADLERAYLAREAMNAFKEERHRAEMTRYTNVSGLH